MAYATTIAVLPSNQNLAVGGVYANGTLVVTGQNLDPATNNRGFLAAFTAAGAKVFAKAFSSTNSLEIRAMTAGASGNIYIGGKYSGTSVNFGNKSVDASESEDGFVAAFTSSGNNLWATKIGGFGDQSVEAITVDPNGQLYIAAHFNSGINLPTSGQSLNFTTNGGDDVLLAQINAGSGSGIWGKQLGGSGDQRIGGVAACNGNLMIASSFQGELSLGSSSEFGATANWDAYVGRFDSSGGFVQ